MKATSLNGKGIHKKRKVWKLDQKKKEDWRECGWKGWGKILWGWKEVRNSNLRDGGGGGKQPRVGWMRLLVSGESPAPLG